MKRLLVPGFVGGVLGLAMLWWISGLAGFSIGFFQSNPVPRGPNPQRGINPCNPCAPNRRRRGNPCNPCSGTAPRPTNPCNPSRATARQAANPCNPGYTTPRRAANPCNPGSTTARQAANPCNPGSATPRASANPCNPGAGSAGLAPWERKGPPLSWGAQYATYRRVGRVALSRPHGNRFVVTYVRPEEAARVYERNGRLAEKAESGDFQDYPVGTVIVQETQTRPAPVGPTGATVAAPNPLSARVPPPGKADNPPVGGKPGSGSLSPGPLFLMKKEAPGYDPQGRDWRYAATGRDMRITIGNGNSGRVGFCKECHSAAEARDFVYATNP